MMQESTMTWFEKVETSKILKWSTFIMAFLVVLSFLNLFFLVGQQKEPKALDRLEINQKNIYTSGYETSSLRVIYESKALLKYPIDTKDFSCFRDHFHLNFLSTFRAIKDQASKNSSVK
jgi:hypothetical protein